MVKSIQRHLLLPIIQFGRAHNPGQAFKFLLGIFHKKSNLACRAFYDISIILVYGLQEIVIVCPAKDNTGNDDGQYQEGEDKKEEFIDQFFSFDFFHVTTQVHGSRLESHAHRRHTGMKIEW